MSEDLPSARAADRISALIVVCVLAVASLVIAVLGVTPARVSATALLGDPRSPGERAFIASHRGGAADAPENTLPAIAAALAGGFEYVEVDVALTSDGHPVLLHDASVDRTTDGHGRIAELTLAEVRALDAGSWFAPEYAGTPIPTAAEFLDLLASADRRAIIELKGEWDAAAAAALVGEIAARDLDTRVAIASFDARTLAAVGQANATVSRLVILKKLPDDIVQAARQLDARGVIVARRAVIERPEVVDEFHAAGVRVIVYTLNSDDQWDAATAIGVDGIVTDDPGTLSSWQDRAAAR